MNSQLNHDPSRHFLSGHCRTPTATSAPLFASGRWTAADTDTPPSPPSPPAAGALLDEKTFAARIVLIFGTVTDALAADVTRRLLALAAAGSDPIDVMVSSPGGHLESGDVIHDVIGYIDAPVNLIGTGWVGSAATHLFLAVPRERRVCLPNTRFLIHQPSSGIAGRASDIAIHARELLRARERIAAVIARETGRSLATVLEDIERDRWMSAEEALDYGLVSRIIRRRSELPARAR